jgi:hypothetical protein
MEGSHSITLLLLCISLLPLSSGSVNSHNGSVVTDEKTDSFFDILVLFSQLIVSGVSLDELLSKLFDALQQFLFITDVSESTVKSELL